MDNIDPIAADGTTALDEAYVTSELIKRRPLYSALVEEVRFILETAITRQSIKIHTIETRIKEIDSVIDKYNRKKIIDLFRDITDLAGCRVICLFRSDLDKFGYVIEYRIYYPISR
jgi:putative GTP pyrophosphokinase